jgi:hypothetical protein
MAEDFETRAKNHFCEAIREVFPDPTPLIGEKWFRFYPGRKPADMEFIGLPKLAKATGLSVKRIGKQVLRKLSEEHLGARLELTEDHWILVHCREKPELKGPAPAKKPAAGKEAKNSARAARTRKGPRSS